MGACYACRVMNLAFCLPKYFPYGGLQSNFLRIAAACQARGCRITVYTLAWEGPVPDGFSVTIVPVRARQNHTRNAEFIAAVIPQLNEYHGVIGFMKMPGLDFYYAADPCYRAKVQTQRAWIYRLSPRYRTFTAFEQAVFRADGNTEILILTESEMACYQACYGTPATRFHLLPPGIARNRMASADAPLQRAALRAELGLGVEDRMLLAVGSGFRTKGLDRTLRALAALPPELRNRTQLYVVGEGKTATYRRLAHWLNVHEQVHFLGGRDDVPRLLFAADLLAHPARTENTGNILLEALVAGLPVLTTANCGYAFHVEHAQAGQVLPLPFQQQSYTQALAELLVTPQRQQYSDNGIHYGRREDLYSRPQIAADLILARAGR